MSRRPSTTHADRLMIRELYSLGRTDVSKLTLKQIGDKFDLSAASVLRIVQLDQVEMELMRYREERMLERQKLAENRDIRRKERVNSASKLERTGSRAARMTRGVLSGLDRCGIIDVED